MAPRRGKRKEIEPEWEWTDDISDINPNPESTESYAVRHYSASCDGTHYKVGDLVQIRCKSIRFRWVGLIRGFEYDTNSDYKTPYERKRVIVLWFNRQGDIKFRKRKDAHIGEIYMTALEDGIILGSVLRHATVFASQEQYWKYRQKATDKNPDSDATYVCNMATFNGGQYWFNFNWADVYRKGDTDFDGIKAYINQKVAGLKSTRTNQKPKRAVTKDISYEESDENEDEEMPPAKKSRKQSNQPTPKKPTSATSTPRSSRIKKDLEITPLNTRTLPSSLLESPYKLAQARLHVSAVPTSLPCREKEYDQILDFLEGAIDEGTGGCIYISGVPGTGKTATVREVLAALRKQADEDELDEFTSIEINGLKVLDPNQAYAMLWEALTGERVTPLHAASLLDAHFKASGPNRVPFVVLLDELDQLVMAKQTVLYNLFNWPTLPNSRLIVVAISNTMNLTDMLPNKIQSRVGLIRVNFEPYTTPQLIKIIESRLENVPGNIVEYDAIRLCSMRIANNTGDARKALDVCRRAVEIAEAAVASAGPSTPSKRPGKKLPTTEGKVTTALLSSVLNEFLRHPTQLTLKHLPFTSKLFLAALTVRIRRSAGKLHVTFGDVIEEARLICLKNTATISEAEMIMKGVTTPRGLESAGIELEVCKLIDWEERAGRGARVGLQISDDDLNMAFGQDDAWRSLVK